MTIRRRVHMSRLLATGLFAVMIGSALPTESQATSCNERKAAGTWAFNVASETNASGTNVPSTRVARIDLQRDGVAVFRQKKYLEGGAGQIDGDEFEAEWHLDDDCFGLIDFPTVTASNGAEFEIDILLLYAAKDDKLHLAFSNPLISVRADRLGR